MKNILRIILAIIILISGTYTYFGYTQELEENKVYEDAYQYIDNTVVEDIIPDPDAVVDFGEMAESGVEQIARIQLNYSWDELFALNSDVVGWLYVPDNDIINFPVVQGEDNSYYLNHDYKRKYNESGAAFLDYKCNKLCLSKIIYGHNMSLSSTKPIFTTIVNWKEREYFDSHRTLFYTTKKGFTSEYAIVAVAHFNVSAKEEYSYLDHLFETEEEFRGWVDYIKDHSIFYDLGEHTIDYRADEVIVLSTCDRRMGHNGNGRTILFCVNITNDLIGG